MCCAGCRKAESWLVGAAGQLWEACFRAATPAPNGGRGRRSQSVVWAGGKPRCENEPPAVARLLQPNSHLSCGLHSPSGLPVFPQAPCLPLRLVPLCEEKPPATTCCSGPTTLGFLAACVVRPDCVPPSPASAWTGNQLVRLQLLLHTVALCVLTTPFTGASFWGRAFIRRMLKKPG